MNFTLFGAIVLFNHVKLSFYLVFTIARLNILVTEKMISDIHDLCNSPIWPISIHVQNMR